MLLLTLFSTIALANEAPPFCADAYQAVCGPSQPARSKEREQELAIELRTSVLAGILGAPQAIGAMATRFFMLPHMSVDYERQYLTGIELVAQRRAGVTPEDVASLFGELKSYFLSLTRTRPKFQERLERMELVSSDDYIFKHGKKMEYVEICGASGLFYNALNQEPRVVVCPGLYVALAARGATREQSLDYLALALGHEIAHAVDVESFPRAYPFLRGKAEVRNELSADGWAISAGVERFRQRSGHEAAAAWSFYYSGFCGQSTIEHAPDAARIAYLARRPDVRRQLGCPSK